MIVGVYGGTFNPVHFGHLRTALEVKEIFDLQEIRLIPCYIPPHRQQPEVSAEMRLRMLQLAVEDVPGMVVDRRELDRAGPSYMIDTLRSLRREMDAGPLLLFIGNDAFAKLQTWYQWEKLFDYAHIVVMTRPGFQLSELGEFFNRCLTEQIELLRRNANGLLYFHHVTQLDISSTEIRKLFACGRNPQFLMPDAVIDYIKQHRLYQ